jgi:hypothetical protein
MKQYAITLFTLVLCLTFPGLRAQEDLPVPLKDNSIYYEEVVKVDTLIKKDALFQKAKLWVAKNFVTTGNFNPIQYEDRESGIMTIRVSLKQFESSFFIHTYAVNVSCVGTIQVKDGRYKYTFTDFLYSSLGDYTVNGEPVKEDGSGTDIIRNAESGASKKLYLSYLSQINSLMNNTIINTLKKSMAETISDDF